MDEDIRDLVLKELSLLTGVVNPDRSYLYYLLLKDGSYFKSKEETIKCEPSANAVEDFESWFDKL